MITAIAVPLEDPSAGHPVRLSISSDCSRDYAAVRIHYVDAVVATAHGAHGVHVYLR